MSFKNISIETVGLHVGASKWNVPDQAKLSKAGTFTCSGISIFGDCNDIGGVATVTIGTSDGDSLQKNMKLSLNVKGNTVMKGDSQTDYALTISGGSKMPLYVAGDAIFTAISPQTLSSRFSKADGLPVKPFDIQHPTKGEGWRLRHVSLEGPESGVYYRGRTRTNEINLPYYWKDLVHSNSITVQIQPIGHPQNIIVKKFDNEKIIIDSENTWIDCFFHVYGERKDVNPLLTEYEGNNRYDYPDPNFNENSGISVEDRNYTDPKYNFPRNTITS